MAGREMLRAPLDGCTLCGLPSRGHGERLGMGHLGDDRKTFVRPSANLIEQRKAARLEPATGLPYGAFTPQGEQLTGLVQATCRCGATAVATPERAPTARCSACITTDIEEQFRDR